MVWEKSKIGEIGTVITGTTPPSSKPECFGSEFPFITPSDMDGRKVIRDSERYLSDAGAKLLKTRRLPANSVAVSCIGWQMGKVVLVGEPSFTNQQINTVIPHDWVNPDFLYYSLSTKRPELQMLGSVGTRTPILNKSAFEQVQVVLPPLETQRQIATILSAYDDLIENNSRRIKVLEEMAGLIYREWFVNFRFPGHEDVPMVASELGEIPEGWKVATVEEVVSRQKPGQLYSQKNVQSEGTIPVLDQGKSGIIGYHDDEPGVQASEENPVLVFANHTCYQRIVQFPFSAIQNVLPFVPKSELGRNIYWLHWTTKDLVEFNDYKGHWPEFMAKRLLLPPRPLSNRFGEAAEPMVRQIFKLEQRNRNLRQTRDLLLPKLISGELDVSTLGDEAALTEAVA